MIENMTSNGRKWIPLGAFGCFAAVMLILQVATAEQEGPDGEVLAIALQTSGKSVVAGRFGDHYIMRLNQDGTLDGSFQESWGAGGFNRPVLALAVQTDDGLIAAGEFTGFNDSLCGNIVRLNADGSLDAAFAGKTGTGFDDTVGSLEILPDGKLLVSGSFSSFNGSKVAGVARLNSDGTLDPALGPVATAGIFVGSNQTPWLTQWK